MALNKKKTSPMLKIAIIVVSVMMVLAFTLPLLPSGVFDGSSNGTQQDSSEIESIATQYSQTTAYNDQVLESDPTSYTILVTQGNTYFDWAAAVQAATSGSGADKPMWVSASVFYDRALEVQPGDPSVGTDLSIAYFYSGFTSLAIDAVETVIETTPDFPAAYFNATIFYDTAGRSADAVAAGQTFLELDPEGTSGNLQVVEDIIAQNSAVQTAP